MVELCERHKLSVIVLLLFSAINILALVGNVLVVSEPEDLVERIVNYLDTQSEQLRDEVLLNTVREILVKNTTEHFALPLTVSIVLLCSNLLAIWGVLFNLHLLVSSRLNTELKSFNYSSQIWPWLLVHFIYLIFLVSLLVYLLIILTNVWLQVILFLVLAPVIIILLTSWLLLLSCSNSLQRGDKARSLAGLAPPSVPTQLMTLYAPQTPIWLAPSATGPGRSRRARSESVCLSEKFANSESAGGKNKAISNVHTSSLEIEIADRTKQNVGSLRGKPGRERRRMRSGCSSLSEKYSPKLSRSYNNDPKQDLIVELPNIMPPASK